MGIFRRNFIATKTRFYVVAIELAGRGLFWPIVAGFVAILALVIALNLGLIIAFAQHNILAILAILTLVAAFLRFFRPDPVWQTVFSFLIFYILVSLPTLIWASYPGIGGGVTELASWITLGAISLAVIAPVLSFLRVGFLDEDSGIIGTWIGYGIGAVTFTIYHVTGRPPVPGDWWVAVFFSVAASLIGLLFGPGQRRRTV